MRAKRGFFAAFGLRSHNNLQKIYDWDGNFEFIREVWTDSSRGRGGRQRAHPAGEGRREAGAAQRGRAARQGRPTEAEAAPAGVRGAGSGQTGRFGRGKRDAPPWAYRRVLQLKHLVQQASEDCCTAAEGREYRKFTGRLQKMVFLLDKRTREA